MQFCLSKLKHAISSCKKNKNLKMKWCKMILQPKIVCIYSLLPLDGAPHQSPLNKVQKRYFDHSQWAAHVCWDALLYKLTSHLRFLFTISYFNCWVTPAYIGPHVQPLWRPLSSLYKLQSGYKLVGYFRRSKARLCFSPLESPTGERKRYLSF